MQEVSMHWFRNFAVHSFVYKINLLLVDVSCGSWLVPGTESSILRRILAEAKF